VTVAVGAVTGSGTIVDWKPAANLSGTLSDLTNGHTDLTNGHTDLTNGHTGLTNGPHRF
jgi:hypothetical protein